MAGCNVQKTSLSQEARFLNNRRRLNGNVPPIEACEILRWWANDKAMIVELSEVAN